MNTTSSRAVSVVASALLLLVVITGEAHAADGANANAQPPRLVSMSPEGTDSEDVRQIRLQFDRAVVPVGRMERNSQEIAIAITPRLACQWRWISAAELACNLDRANAARPATRYSVSVPKRFDLTADPMDADRSFSFSTSRPGVEYQWIKTWDSPTAPLIGLRTTMQVSREELERHLQLVDGSKRIIAVSVGHFPVDSSEGLSPEDLERERLLKWLITPKGALEPGAEYGLVLGAGMKGVEGNLTSAERKILAFSTFGSFTLKGISCSSTADTSLFFAVGAQKAEVSRCDPLNAVRLQFSAPVAEGSLFKGITTVPDISGGQRDFNPWEDVYVEDVGSAPHTRHRQYTVMMPYGLKANASYDVLAHAGEVKDIFGRALASDEKVAFSTDHRLPRYVLDNPISVLEKGVGSKLPVVVNNLKSLKVSYQSVTSDSNRASLNKTYTPYAVEDIAYPYPIDVADLLGGKSGVVQGQLSTQPSTAAGDTWFLSQVTPFSVHVKLGHFNSVVWVTSFATGLPIEGAKVTIVEDTLTKLSKAPRELGSGQTDASGIAQLAGTETVDPERKLSSQWERSQPRLVLKVEKGDDMAIVPVGWDFAVYSEGVYPNSQAAYGHVHSWGTTAQGLYKAGDTVQFSLWVRGQDNRTLIPAPRGPYALEVRDPLDKVVYSVPEMELSEFGSFSGEFATPSNAAVGWYEFSLRPKFSRDSMTPLRVLISDFTPAPFKVESRIADAPFVEGSEVTVTAEARLHAGGPYADAKARVTALIRGAALSADAPALEGFTFDSSEQREEQIYQQELELDEAGDLQAQFTVPPNQITFGNLVVESAVRDDRGKFVAATSREPYFGRDRYVGLTIKEWLLTAGKEVVVEGMVIGQDRKPVAGALFSVKVQYADRKAARVKSAGNAYLTRLETEWVDVADCALTSQREPQRCVFTPQKPGDYKVTATVTDSAGREHSTTIEPWVVGKGFVVWTGDTNTQLRVVPEKRSYKVGEKARFMVQNPFPGAQVLLTTERYGVLSSWTKRLADGGEVVEVEITKDLIPGFFFSATVSSPRVDKPIEGQVDLGKPTFRMGYAQIEVVDSAKELAVDVKPRGDVFKPRDSVTVDLTASARDGAPPPIQYAVTVLDEAVFDLIQNGKAYFDPYRGFYTLDGLDVENFNLMRLLIGRQKFEKKGANQGGDGGGKLDMRSLIKYVSYWNPAVPADAQGKASISFDAPDNLTGWKVFAMAISKSDMMGLGVGGFKVNKELELRAALPNQVREGDEFTAVFTVMNRTERVRNITVDITSERDGKQANAHSTVVSAEPFKRVPVAIDASAGRAGAVKFKVKASDGEISDAFAADLVILPRAQLQTSATFGSSDAKEVQEMVSFPSSMRGDMGSVGVALSPSVVGSLQGAFEYMREYPYDCWEQKLSKGVMAANSVSLKSYLPKDFEWPEAAAIAARLPGDLGSYQAPNGGVVFWVPQDDRVSLYLSAYTALALSWLRDAGYAIPEDKERALHEFLKGYLKTDAGAQAQGDDAMGGSAVRASLRGVILAALARRGAIDGAEVVRFRRGVKEMSLFARAHYLIAAVVTKTKSDVQREVLASILAQGTQSAAGMSFTEGQESWRSSMLDSPMRTQCAVLSALLAYGAQSKEAKAAVDPVIPKLVHTITVDRKRKDRWENTQENIFCMTALAEYARTYEAVEPNMELSVKLAGKALGTASFADRRAEAVDVSRPVMETDPGTSQALSIQPSGKGRFYYSTRLRFAPRELKATATNAGLEVVREYSIKVGEEWKLVHDPVAVKQGDLVKVDLFLRLGAPHYFVVVDDPVPGGLEAVNRDLKTSSAVDDAPQEFVGAKESMWFGSRWIEFGTSWEGFYHRELRNSAARFFADYLPVGDYHLSYTAQAIASGRFVALPAHAEEMYDPDVFGESAPDSFSIAASR
jgi:uncharacterized protein YfaS (alpha-2-macroglobulin family)